MFSAVYGDFEAVYKVPLHAYHPVDNKSIALNVDTSLKGNWPDEESSIRPILWLKLLFID